MKNYLFGLCILGLTNLAFCQNDIAMSYPSVGNTYDMYFNDSAISKSAIKNYVYLNETSSVNLASRIEQFHKIVANYDVKTESCYVANKKAKYKVDFKETFNKITATFDENGTILSTKEVYTNVRLPIALSQSISKSYPNWTIDHVECHILYDGDNSSPTYKVRLKNGSQHKNIAFL
ncbi:MAG: hypothetical protein WA775_09725 [Psychroserpens sp.]|uniref:hypothetical protein n=1 Tax=Psychroserpens sp. TaxID=2020870 RepID=UPI003C770BD6